MTEFAKVQTSEVTPKLLAITIDGEAFGEATVEQFLRDNVESDEVDPASVGAMAVGDSLTFGGGAAPVVTVRRVA